MHRVSLHASSGSVAPCPTSLGQHSAVSDLCWGGRTPDEVYFGREAPERPLGRVDYFDGGLHWYRLG